jgi:hypothetical protein
MLDSLSACDKPLANEAGSKWRHCLHEAAFGRSGSRLKIFPVSYFVLMPKSWSMSSSLWLVQLSMSAGIDRYNSRFRSLIGTKFPSPFLFSCRLLYTERLHRTDKIGFVLKRNVKECEAWTPTLNVEKK